MWLLGLLIIIYLTSSSESHLNESYLRVIANQSIDNYPSSLNWFADHAKLFSFSQDKMVELQGYYLPTSNLKHNLEDQIYKPIVFCTGFTEFTVKYVDTLRLLHEMGHDVFSFDLRSQGFSSSLYRSSDGRKIIHVDSFQEYVNDLTYFMESFVMNTTWLTEYTLHPFNQLQDIQPIYMGVSLGGLIGISQFAQKPGLFKKYVLISPCIRPMLGTTSRDFPLISWLNSFAIYLFRYTHLTQWISKKLLIQIGYDDYDDVQNELEHSLKSTHSATKFHSWRMLRSIDPPTLLSAGASCGFVDQMLLTSDQVIQAGPSLAFNNIDFLVFSAENDDFVDTTVNEKFFGTLGQKHACTATPSHEGVCENFNVKYVKVLNSYHELLIEYDKPYQKVMKEIETFLS